jgi:NitT/TauT family transport system substrate-binding protein
MIALVLSAISSVAVVAQNAESKVRIQDYPGVGNTLFRTAAAKGFCQKHGITCQLQMIASGPLGAQALLAKSIDVGFFPPEVQINAMIKGARLQAILSGSRLNSFVIVARNDLDIPHAGGGFQEWMADLKGRKIGVPARGGGAELQFALLAEKAGLSATDFTFVAVGAPTTSYGALVSRQIDVSMSFEPAGSMCDVLKTCKTLVVQSEAQQPAEIVGTNGAATVMVVTEDIAKDEPHVIDALIATAKEAELFLQDPTNFDEVLRISRTFFTLDLPRGDEIMALSLKRTIPTFKAPISRPALKQIADNMFSLKQIDAPFDTTKLTHAKAP